ncbi:hypothetical protein EJ357_22385 [Streptomyces cyaneochromogenes]|uniref:Uncharacterized protein n=1 Tax=Streptomyces cyaneochromogenes TaxID=2496836 RepID=A0A3S9M9Q4_9ACTN|nr:hypothetical protein [Streptomyces cyaneochromogenes]AZQ35890.1 hypothetical protein EJ357_22385 [Streptomyces cyaneochromogenes]
MLRSPWTTWTHGRRCALIGASAAVVCLGGVLAACGGGGGGEGYVATGAAGGPPRVSGPAARPTGEVTLVPLDGPAGSDDGDAGGTAAASGNSAERDGSQAPPASDVAESPAQLPSGTPEPAGKAADSAAPPSSSPAPPAAATPPTPARLTVSDPVREPTDKRWCEKVTLDFHNSGGTAVRAGTVAFGTHIIGALGIDWATVESTHELPAPIEAGARKEKTWTVCVDAWRVPLGMHVETRDVTVQWE